MRVPPPSTRLAGIQRMEKILIIQGCGTSNNKHQTVLVFPLSKKEDHKFKHFITDVAEEYNTCTDDNLAREDEHFQIFIFPAAARLAAAVLNG